MPILGCMSRPSKHLVQFSEIKHCALIFKLHCIFDGHSMRIVFFVGSSSILEDFFSRIKRQFEVCLLASI